jgi:hypothetical protein
VGQPGGLRATSSLLCRAAEPRVALSWRGFTWRGGTVLRTLLTVPMENNVTNQGGELRDGQPPRPGEFMTADTKGGSESA